jgi:hypothetical protein
MLLDTIATQRQLVSNFKQPLSQSSSPGSTGRPSIPETLVIEPKGRGVLDAPLSRSMTTEGNVNPRSRDTLRPSYCKNPPSKTKRAQGMPDARCTRGRLCSKKSTGVSNQGYTASTGIPCAMVLTVSFVLFPGTGFFAPVTRETRKRLHELSACIGAPEPHDFAVRCSIIRPRKKLRLTLQRPSHPTPNVRDDREPPLFSGARRAKASL